MSNKPILSSLLISCIISCNSEKSVNDKPNVIIIYTDDQGTLDVNCYGATDLVTPNMDKLIKSGVKFTQFYGAPISSPSRAGLLTGKTPQRAGVPLNIGVTGGLKSDQFTIAKMFKSAGYKTALIGKWHLGRPKENQPNAHGFDYSFGHLGGCIDNYSHFVHWTGPNRHDLYRNGEEVFYYGQFFPDLMVKEASSFIEKNKNNPFFLYFAINTPHYPYQGYTKWLKYYGKKGLAYPRNLYAAFISTQDEKIGELVKIVKKHKLIEKTIIIFQSDNGYTTEARGHYGGGYSGIYRGAKTSLFEGGIRVPAAISWPPKIKAGEVRDQVGVNADWMPTLAEFCGIDISGLDIDGKSLVPVIMDKNAESPHKDGFCWQIRNHWVARIGDWKLHGNPATPGEKFPPGDSLFLVNLENDPGERNNVIDKYPEKAKELQLLYNEWKKRN